MSANKKLKDHDDDDDDNEIALDEFVTEVQINSVAAKRKPLWIGCQFG